MSTVSTTVNVGECCPGTPGSFNVRAFYKELNDSGHVYGTFASREAAERCVQILAARSDVLNATIEGM